MMLLTNVTELDTTSMYRVITIEKWKFWSWFIFATWYKVPLWKEIL